MTGLTREIDECWDWINDEPPRTRCPDCGHMIEDGAEGCQDCAEMKRDAWADSELDRARGR